LHIATHLPAYPFSRFTPRAEDLQLPLITKKNQDIINNGEEEEKMWNMFHLGFIEKELATRDICD
jgi:hypothetical protein